MLGLIGILWLFCQNADAQILEKGTIKFKTIISKSPNAKQEMNVFFDSTLIKVAQFMVGKGATKEEVELVQAESKARKSEIMQTFDTEISPKKEDNYLYTIRFSPTEVLREKFDMDNKKVKHELIYADGRVVGYDFWTNKAKPTYLNEDNLHVLPNPMTVVIDKNDRKKILNYDCYKVKVLEKMPENEVEEVESEEDLFNQVVKGEIIYEMYVTEEVKLFPHAVLDLTNPLKGYFPLETVSYMNILPAIKMTTTATSIQ